MTTKSLVRTSHLDWDRARDALRDRAGSAHTLGQHRVRVIVEPLLRRGADGRLERAIKVDADVPITAAVARDASGTDVTAGLEESAGGLRVFVAESDTTVKIHLSLPELSAVDEAVLAVEPARRWDIHLVHHSHLDIGYTDPQGRVLAEHVSYLDSALRLVKETSDWTPDAQFRWSVESLWSFEQWAGSRPDSVVRDFIDYVKQGRIELTAMPFNLHTETCSTDELHELLRLADRTRKRYDVPITAAMQSDVPGSVSGLVDALAGNGVGYLSVAHNWAGRSVPHLVGGQDVPRLFWWQSPSGRRVLVWVTDTPHGLAYMEGPMLGFDTSYDDVERLLPAYLVALATQPYPFDGNMFGFPSADIDLHRAPYDLDTLHLRVQGHFGDNAPPRRIMSETVRQWNERWAYPHLRLSTNTDFFVSAEERYGDRVPTFVGDWNDWWADGVGSGARPMQLVRRAQALLADAQTASTLAGVLGAAHAERETADAVEVYGEASLFNEHTWGAADPWTHGDDHQHSGDEQWHWKYHKAMSAHDGAQELLDTSRARLAEVLGTAPWAAASVHVLNTTSTRRSGTVTVFVPDSQVPLEVPLRAVDARTGDVIPRAESPQLNPTHREHGRFLHLAVADVPPLGLVRVDLLVGGEPAAGTTKTAASDGPVLENELLRVEVDLRHACIGSILAKVLGKELVNPDATFGFNAYVYDELGSAGGGINHQSGLLEARDLGLLGRRSLADPAAFVESGTDAVHSWLTYLTSGPGASRITTTLSLEHGSDRLDITNRVEKAPTLAKESAYFAFPFAGGPEPVVRYDITGSVGGTDIPFVPGGATHMRAIRRWVAVGTGEHGIAWATHDAPLVQLADIAVPYAPFPLSTPQTEPGTIYSWIHNNLWDTNFPIEQGLNMAFHYSVSATGATRPDEISAFAADRAAGGTQPLLGVLGSEPADESSLRAETELLSVSDERVRVVGLTTPAAGTVLVRLQSVADTEVTVTLTPGVAAVHAAWTASYLGEPQSELAVTEGAVQLTVPPLSTAACVLEFRL